MKFIKFLSCHDHTFALRFVWLLVIMLMWGLLFLKFVNPHRSVAVNTVLPSASLIWAVMAFIPVSFISKPRVKMSRRCAFDVRLWVLWSLVLRKCVFRASVLTRVFSTCALQRGSCYPVEAWTFRNEFTVVSQPQSENRRVTVIFLNRSRS